jgi:hypothetical protein
MLLLINVQNSIGYIQVNHSVDTVCVDWIRSIRSGWNYAVYKKYLKFEDDLLFGFILVL